jgi:hypothetical protein
VAGLCAARTDVEFVGYPGGTHMSVLADGSHLNADLERRTAERFAGTRSTPNCP